MIQVTGAPEVIYHEGFTARIVQEANEPPHLLILMQTGKALVFPLTGELPKQIEHELARLRTGIHIATPGEAPNGDGPRAA